MRSEQISWNEGSGWRSGHGAVGLANLVFYFGTRQALACGARYDELRLKFPGAHLLGCSTGGQIRNDDVTDDDIAGLALGFDRTALRLATATVAGSASSRACGESMGRALAQTDGDKLKAIFVLSDGLNINGSELVAGIAAVVGNGVALTGGMAGDGALFEETLVGGDGPPRTHQVAAVGFYGDAVRIGHGSAGGWDEFGPRRRISRAEGNVLYELDGKPALDLYKRYLGDEADGLPGTALLFPLRICDPNDPDNELVRTVLAVDHDTRSMTFAGDMPEGWVAQLMRGNLDRLALGAADAARQAAADIGARNGVAILVSCIGRRLLMGQRATEEVEAAGSELGRGMPRLGFYSYGEIAPHHAMGECQLHNQTMTVTVISETDG
ncbi:MAG: FIST N-terminal domain-containing protein [Pseudolabrys sp.]|nr:FIST N-terminal domain-containing protein [Pseudolabrys sp.]